MDFLVLPINLSLRRKTYTHWNDTEVLHLINVHHQQMADFTFFLNQRY